MFQNYKNTNNGRSKLKVGILAGDTSLILTDGEGALFPATNFIGTITEFDIDGFFVKKEVVKVTSRTNDVCSITRAFESCVQDERQNPKVSTQNALTFSASSYFEQMRTAGDSKDVKDEIVRLETDKSDDNSVVHLAGNETITGKKTFNTELPESSIVPIDGVDLVNKDYVDGEIINATEIQELSISIYTNGEVLLEGNTVFVETLPAFAVATSVQNIGDITGNKRVSIPIIGNGTSFTSIKLALKKFVSPSVDLGLRIETDNAGIPSGTLVTNGTATILTSGLTTSLVDTTITLAGTITPSDGTKYHIVLFGGTYGSETVNGTNYFGVGYSTNNTTTRGMSLYNGTQWASYFFYDNFPGTSLSSYWTNTGLNVNNSLYKSIDYSNAENTLFAKSISTNSGFLCLKLNGVITTTYYGNTGSSDVYIRGKLFWDSNNYIEIATGCNTNESYVKSNYYVYCKLVVGGATIYSTNIQDDATDIKVEYNPVNGEIKFYYWTTSRQQLGVTQTNIYSGNPYSYLTIDGGTGLNVGVIVILLSINHFYLTNYVFATLNPTASSLSFPYISCVGAYNELLSLTDSDYSYKVNMRGINKETVIIGVKPKITIDGINSNQTGLTEETVYYLNSTPGSIGTTPGTNKCVVGKSINKTQIKLNKKLQDVSITVGVSPFTRSNTNGNTVQVKTIGGTVSNIVLDGVSVATATSNILNIPTGKSLTVTYTVLPTLTYSDL